MNKVKSWIEAFRLKTLPLAFSCIIMGSVVAYDFGYFRLEVLVMALITTLCLQVLSNLANDYGDAIKGTDNELRLGPRRAVQSGLISKSAMMKGVVLFAILSFISGSFLLYLSFQNFNLNLIVFLLLGCLSIAAAIKYTVGKNAYGYLSLGDLFVFLFFGWLGVSGVFFLHGETINALVFLPATCIGLMSVGVLNLNNLRDIVNDKENNKITVAVRLGSNRARYYHLVLLSLAWLAQIAYVLIKGNSSWAWLFLLSLPLFYLNGKKALLHSDPKELIPSLKQLALGTFLFTLLYSIGLLISYA
ncbi:MAG: 1,4-dihydroxy-2-naphthoate octaprenyltransferase [Crocinitomicaceae bacterium]|nr:1,4-dihydroxy-2-naphthoate octaprenyltransferase [Crocinitomicaceae bacterium]